MLFWATWSSRVVLKSWRSFTICSPSPWGTGHDALVDWNPKTKPTLPSKLLLLVFTQTHLSGLCGRKGTKITQKGNSVHIQIITNTRYVLEPCTGMTRKHSVNRRHLIYIYCKRKSYLATFRFDSMTLLPLLPGWDPKGNDKSRQE